MSESRVDRYPNPATMAARELREKEIEDATRGRLNDSLTLGTLMRVPYFRQVVGRWMAKCGLDEPIKGSNSNEMQQALGRREIGLMIKKELEEADLELYHQMVKENRNKKTEVKENG